MKKLFSLIIIIVLLYTPCIFADEEVNNNNNNNQINDEENVEINDPTPKFCLNGGDEEKEYELYIYDLYGFKIKTLKVKGNNCVKYKFPENNKVGDVAYTVKLEKVNDERYYTNDKNETLVIVSTRDDLGSLETNIFIKGNNTYNLYVHKYTVAMKLNPVNFRYNNLTENTYAGLQYDISINNKIYNLNLLEPVIIRDLRYDSNIILLSQGRFTIDNKMYIVKDMKSKIIDDEKNKIPEMFDLIDIRNDTSPFTGVNIDTIPFILLLLISALGAIIYIFIRRKNNILKM